MNIVFEIHQQQQQKKNDEKLHEKHVHHSKGEKKGIHRFPNATNRKTLLAKLINKMC